MRETIKNGKYYRRISSDAWSRLGASVNAGDQTTTVKTRSV